MLRTEALNKLGVKATATPAEIKLAYKKLASRHHPDKGGDAEKFKEIKDAYETLTSSQGEGIFNNGRAYSTGPVDTDVLNEIFARMSGAAPGGPFAGFNFKEQKPHRQMAFTIDITMEEAFSGAREKFTVPNNPDIVEIWVHPGTYTGTQAIKKIKLKSGEECDIIITFKIKPHPTLVLLEDGTIKHQKSISLIDFLKADSINVKTIDGTTLAVKLPAERQPGMVLRLKNKGFYRKSTNDKLSRADFLIELNPVFPKLTSEQISKIEDILNA